MGLLDRVLRRRKHQSPEPIADSADDVVESAITAENTPQDASNLISNQIPADAKEFKIAGPDNSRLSITADRVVFSGIMNMTDKSTITNFIDQGKPVLEALSREMTQGADVDSFARHPPPRCYPGTRKSLTAKAQKWLLDDQREWDMLWLHGPAGVGKSAVAQTLAEFAIEQSRLGAAFFFSQANDRYDPQPVFITIAYQLAVRLPGYLPLVAKQLGADPDLLKKTPHAQFKKLIIEPLSVLPAQPKYLIILDGLDECEGERAQLNIIELINDLILSRTSLPIIWMVCSRPEPHLMRALVRGDFTIQCWRENLPVDTEESREDAATFIHARFKEIHEGYGDCVHDMDGTWPAKVDVDCIVKEASGLFVYASTILKYIEDPISGNPDARLAEVLAVIRHSHLTGGQSPMEALDLLYSRILSEIPSGIWPLTRELLQVTINAEGHGYINACYISNFLGISRSSFYTALRKLHSVLDIPPPTKAHNHNIRFYHLSFRDYLVQRSRSGRFYIPTSYSEQYDIVQKASLRIIGLPLFFSRHILRPSFILKSSYFDIDKLSNEYLSWLPMDPRSDRDMPYNLTRWACQDLFTGYGHFPTGDEHHQALKNMLRTFDFNTFPILALSFSEHLFEFVRWVRKTSIYDLVRTHATDEADNDLLVYSKKLDAGAEPMNFDWLVYGKGWETKPKVAYFLLGHGRNTVLVLVSPKWQAGATYHSLKSPLEIWPSLAEVFGR